MGTNVKKSDLDGGRAFLPDPRSGARTGSSDSLAELVGEGFVSSATNGENSFDERRNEVTEDEIGGPFLETEGTEEFAEEPDPSNPEDATKEPFPTAIKTTP
jgi:hypothetical protein